jgi:hypothetical protein
MNSPYFSGDKAIGTEEAIFAARYVLEVAQKKGVKSAICGGLAMHLYGFTRATKDIDFIADNEIGLHVTRALSFGGLAYKCILEGKDYEVDWIIRNDEQKELYAIALREMIILDDVKLPIITPEWLVIIKHVAGRGKDHMDCVWLLRKDGLVNRDKLIEIIRRVMGPVAFWAVKDLESVMLEADLMRAKDEKGDK